MVTANGTSAFSIMSTTFCHPFMAGCSVTISPVKITTSGFSISNTLNIVSTFLSDFSDFASQCTSVSWAIFSLPSLKRSGIATCFGLLERIKLSISVRASGVPAKSTKTIPQVCFKPLVCLTSIGFTTSEKAAGPATGSAVALAKLIYQRFCLPLFFMAACMFFQVIRPL